MASLLVTGRIMHVVVIGAGVIGVTTAYYLSQLDCSVTVVDRERAVAQGASYGNAGQLSYSFTDALAKPAFLARMPGVLAGRDHAYHMRLTPELIRWGMKFLAQCTNRRAAENTIAVLRNALRSATLMHALRDELPFDFSYRQAGKLVLLATRDEVDAAKESAALKEQYGCKTEIIDADEATRIEPALDGAQGKFIAAVYSREDEVADSRAFCDGMQRMLTASGEVRFRLGEDVRHLNRQHGKLVGVELVDETLQADAVVVCTGAWSDALLRRVKIHPHIYPVRGYSVTLPPGPAAPDVSVTVLGRKFVFSRINGKVRVAGFADFTGFRTDDDDRRIAALLDVARDFAPLAADYESGQQAPWGGFRPMTPSGQPLVGSTRIPGLFVNAGHGMLGWTLACSSGYDVANAIARTAH